MSQPGSSIYVRLPADLASRLDRAVALLDAATPGRVSKNAVINAAVRRYLDWLEKNLQNLSATP